MTADGFRKEWDDGNPFVVGHTSGSTGIPKEIRLSKEDMRVSASITNRFFGIDAGSRLLLCLSPDYIAGKMMIVRALVSGAELAEEKPSNRPLEHYDGLPFDLAAVVPSQALWLAEHPERLRFVRKLIVGGGEISPRLGRLLSGLPVGLMPLTG